MQPVCSRWSISSGSGAPGTFQGLASRSTRTREFAFLSQGDIENIEAAYSDILRYIPMIPYPSPTTRRI